MPDFEDIYDPQKERSHGERYSRICKNVVIKFGLKPEKIEKRRHEKKARFKTEEKNSQRISDEFNEIQLKYGKDSSQYRKAERKFEAVQKKFLKKERIYKQDAFKRAVNFTGMELSIEEVLFFAGLCAVLSLIVISTIAIGIALILKLNVLHIAIYLLLAIIAVPLLVYALIASYPEILANRLRVKSLARAPESVSYLVMSMRLSPSLSKAVNFAAENSEEPLSSGLKKVLWDVYMHRYNSIEESFLAFAFECGEWNEDLKRSLLAIRSSTSEGTSQGLARALEKANEIIIEGTKRRVEGFATSLHGPTTILFALGILLPMIIGAMLPLMALQAPTDLTFTAEANADESNSKWYDALGIVLLMDVVFPLITLIYAYHILGKRPGTSTPPAVKSSLTLNQRRGAVLFAVLIGIVFGALSIPVLRDNLGGIGVVLGSVPIIIGFGFAVGYYCRVTSSFQKKKRNEIKKMEDEFPDALFKLGSRIAEGEPLESAFRKVSESMKGTSIAELFGRIAYLLQVTRSSLDEALFGEMGALKNLPSRTIKATMRTVVETVKKDAAVAGSIIINISDYLRDMRKVDHEIRMRLRETVEMMKTTGILFAPLVMGITASLYVLLSAEFARLPGTSQMVSNDLFFLIIGFYLCFMVLIITYFTVGIEHGEDRIELKHTLGYSMPSAVIIYTLAMVLGQFTIR